MPNSTSIFKKQTLEFIRRHIPTDGKILDVGAGSGIWRHCLPEYPDMHAIEIFPPYIPDFNLEKIYKTVTCGNAIEQPAEFYQGYDLIILGDVVEHMSYEDAISVLDKIPDTTMSIVGVPWGPQGIHNYNVYEIHIQDKLTNVGFLRDYPKYELFCLHHGYAMYVNKTSLPDDEFLYLFEMVPEETEWVHENYPNRKIVDLDKDPDSYIDYTLYGFK